MQLRPLRLSVLKVHIKARVAYMRRNGWAQRAMLRQGITEMAARTAISEFAERRPTGKKSDCWGICHNESEMRSNETIIGHCGLNLMNLSRRLSPQRLSQTCGRSFNLTQANPTLALKIIDCSIERFPGEGKCMSWA